MGEIRRTMHCSRLEKWNDNDWDGQIFLWKIRFDNFEILNDVFNDIDNHF